MCKTLCCATLHLFNKSKYLEMEAFPTISMFLPHVIAKGQGLVPIWNKTLLYIGLILVMIGLPMVPIFIGMIPLLAGLFLLYKGRDSAFVVFGQPDISMSIKESPDTEKALQLVTKLQNESRK